MTRMTRMRQVWMVSTNRTKRMKQMTSTDRTGQDRTMRIAYTNHIHGSLCYCSGLGGYVERIPHLPSLARKRETAFVHRNQRKVIPQPPLQHPPLHANTGHVDCCARECNSTARPTTTLCSTHQRVRWCVCSTSKRQLPPSYDLHRTETAPDRCNTHRPPSILVSAEDWRIVRGACIAPCTNRVRHKWIIHVPDK
jgi:hypothetical protein